MALSYSAYAIATLAYHLPCVSRWVYDAALWQQSLVYSQLKRVRDKAHALVPPYHPLHFLSPLKMVVFPMLHVSVGLLSLFNLFSKLLYNKLFLNCIHFIFLFYRTEYATRTSAFCHKLCSDVYSFLNCRSPISGKMPILAWSCRLDQDIPRYYSMLREIKRSPLF